eukprot:m51a1_g8545 hypothetical protein (140) ;mRNA; r:68228-69094
MAEVNFTQEMRFFGATVKAGEAKEVVFPAEGLLNIQNAAITGGPAAQASVLIKVGERPAVVLAALSASARPQVALDLPVLREEGKIMISVQGKGQVTLVGNFILEIEEPISQELKDEIHSNGERRAKDFDKWAAKYQNK